MARKDLARRVLGRTTDEMTDVAQVAQVVHGTEVAVSTHEVRQWGNLARLEIDVRARLRGSQAGLAADMRLYDEGMEAADGDPVKRELVVRYLQDQNDDNRARVRRAFER